MAASLGLWTHNASPKVTSAAWQHHYPLPNQSNPIAASLPLRVRTAVRRYQSAERPILHQISSLMYPRIQRKRVVMNVLHPGCAQPPRWSPPVFWRRLEDTELYCSATFDYSRTVFFIHISTPEWRNMKQVLQAYSTVLLTWRPEGMETV